MSSGVDELVDVLRLAAQTVRSVTASTAEEIVALTRVVDAAQAAIADRLVEFDQTKAYVEQDASSTVNWARRQLRQDARTTKQQLRAGRTQRDLGVVGESARAGLVSAAHVARFAFALDHVDPDAVAEQAPHLIAVAEAHPPSRVKQVVDRLRAVLHTEELDAAWIAGMDKADISLHQLTDGWHLTGFLPIDVGARFATVLESLSVPRAGGDTRTAAQRRIDGLDQLLTGVLAAGLPTDGTVRPQLHVLVDAGTLQQALNPDAESLFAPVEPATLVGFGPIGPNLLAHLTCGADLIPVLVDQIGPNATVLDVGRRHRDATAKQRHAIWVQQSGVCGTAHCHHSIDHLHHLRPWSTGGPTNLTNLIGLCTTCHRHHHTHHLARAG